MANKKRGYYTLNLGGKQRVMHFSMNFWANFTDMLGISLEKIGDVFADGVSITSLRALVYSGLLAYDQEEGNEIDYNEFKVGMWLEDFDGENITIKYSDGKHVQISRNKLFEEFDLNYTTGFHKSQGGGWNTIVVFIEPDRKSVV